MNKKEKIVSIEKISEMLKKAPTDDGTFYGCIYDLYVLTSIALGVDDINNDRGTPIEEFDKEMEELYAATSRRFS